MNKLLIFLILGIVLFGTIAVVMLGNVAEQNRLIESKELYGKQKGIEVVMDKADVESTFLKEDFNEKYGVIKLSTADVWTPETQTADYSLIESTSQCLINCEARGKAVLYRDGKLFDNALFYDGKRESVSVSSKYYIKVLEDYEVQMPDKLVEECAKEDAENISKGVEALCREVQTYRTEIAQREVWQEYSGKDLVAGNYEWKIVANKPIKSEIDFVPVAQGKNLDAWTWWNTTFLKAKTINITGATEQLINFTVYLNVSQTVSSDFQANFNDVRFVDGACNDTQTIELDYEFDKIIGNVSAGVWVRIPTLKSSMALNENVTQVCMYYNNPTATNGEHQTTTWDNGYTVVMHFTNLTSGYYKNSKSGNTTFMWGVAGAASPEFIPGVFGDALNLSTSGANRYATGGTTPAFNGITYFSAEQWWNEYGSAGASWTRAHFNFLYDKANTYGLIFTNDQWFVGSISWSQGSATQQENPRAWQHTYGNMSFPVVGYAYANKTGKYTAPSGSGGTFGTATYQLAVWNANKFGNADYDEIRLSNVSRSASWNNRSYDNSNISFFVFGAETTSGVSTSVTLNFPTANYDFTEVNPYLNATITATAGNVTNATLFIWNGTQSLTTYYNGTVTTHPANMSVWNVTLTEGNFTWNVYGCSRNATAGACAFAAANLSFNISTTPIFSNEQIAPASPTTYVEYGNYSFNITMVHAAVDKVLLQFNNINYTATKIGDIFNVTIRNQAVANYTYIWFANDTYAHKNSTAPKYYNITRATPTLTLATPSWNVNNGTATTVTGSGCPSQLNCSLRRNNTYVSNPDVQTLGAGIYNYTYDTPGNGNFTAATTTNTLTVTNIPDTTVPNITIYYPSGFIPYVVNGTNVSFNYSIVDDIAPQFCGYSFYSFDTTFGQNKPKLAGVIDSDLFNIGNPTNAYDNLWSTFYSASFQYPSSMIFNFTTITTNNTLYYRARFTPNCESGGGVGLTQDLYELSCYNGTAFQWLFNGTTNVCGNRTLELPSSCKVGNVVSIKFRDYQSFDAGYVLLAELQLLQPNIQPLTQVSCNLNTTINPAGHSQIFLYANDSAGNFNISTSNWSIGLIQYTPVYDPSVYESSTNSFYLPVTYNMSVYTGLTAKLNYSGTQIVTTNTGTNPDNIFYTTQTTPSISGSSEIVYFNWIINATNSTGNYLFSTQQYNHNVSKLTFSRCNLTNNIPFINFTIRDENVLSTRILSDWSASFKYWLDDPLSALNYTDSDTQASPSNTISFAYCALPSTINLTFDGDFGFGASGYSPRSYYIRNLTITSNMTNVNMTLLPTGNSTKFYFSVLNGVQPFQDALVQIWKKSGIDQYYLVNVQKTDNLGQFVEYLEQDKYYQYVIIKDNVILNTIQLQSSCQSAPCSFSLQAQSNLGNVGAGYNETYAAQTESSMYYNKTSHIVTYYFLDQTDTAQYFRLQVYKAYVNGSPNLMICDQTTYAISGVMVCNVTGNVGDITAKGFISRSPEKIDAIIEFTIGTIAEIGGTLMIVFSLFFIITLVFIGAGVSKGNPSVILFYLAIAVTALKLMSIIPFGWGVIALLDIVIFFIIGKMKT